MQFSELTICKAYCLPYFIKIGISILSEVHIQMEYTTVAAKVAIPSKDKGNV